MAMLVNNPEFSDVTFLVDGERIAAHKAILVVRSPYFRAMLTNGMTEANKQVRVFYKIICIYCK
jgi:hypothetical protein